LLLVFNGHESIKASAFGTLAVSYKC